jgi:hypothetical protein
MEVQAIDGIIEPAPAYNSLMDFPAQLDGNFPTPAALAPAALGR